MEGCPLGPHRPPCTPLCETSVFFCNWTSQPPPPQCPSPVGCRSSGFPHNQVGPNTSLIGQGEPQRAHRNHPGLLADSHNDESLPPTQSQAHPPARSPSGKGFSHLSALWESENRLASVSFTIVQSKTSPARVLNVFPVRADRGKMHPS